MDLDEMVDTMSLLRNIRHWSDLVSAETTFLETSDHELKMGPRRGQSLLIISFKHARSLKILDHWTIPALHHAMQHACSIGFVEKI